MRTFASKPIRPSKNILLGNLMARSYINIGGHHIAIEQDEDGFWVPVFNLDNENITSIATAIATALNAASAEPGGYDLTLLASQARATASPVASSDQTNVLGARGAMIFLNVTGAAGALKTLTIDIQAKDPLSGVYGDIGSTGVIGTTVTVAGLYIFIVYPGVGNLLSGLFAGNAALPRTWRIRVTANDATSWTYSVSASLLQ